MNRKKIIIAAVIFVVLATAAGYKVFRPQEHGITATGTIEITRVDITPKVGGYITEFRIKEGDNLTNGQRVAVISRPDLKAQVLRDEAALEKAIAGLKDLEKGARSQERQEFLAMVQSANSVYQKARTDFERYKVLYSQGAISAQQYDSAKSALDVAYQALVSAQQKLSLADEGARPDAVTAQKQEVERNKAILASSRSQLADTIITTPRSGLVLSKNYENNEYVNPGSPIATIGDMQDCWVKVYVASTQLGLIKIGQQVNVKVDSFPDKIFHGHIKEISQTAEFTPRQSLTQRERANQVFAVKVKLDNSRGILKPGMPADVIIL